MPFSAAFVDRLRAGETSAFVELMDRTAPTVRMIVRKYHRSPFEQEEVAQEIWLTIYGKREQLRAEMASRLEGWVATVARNKAIDLARARGRRPEVVTEDVPEPTPEEAPAPQLVRQRQLREAVEDFARPLEPQWRDFFELHFVQGLAYPEISRRMGITRLRCKYMKRVLASQAREHPALLSALGRLGPTTKEEDHAR